MQNPEKAVDVRSAVITEATPPAPSWDTYRIESSWPAPSALEVLRTHPPARGSNTSQSARQPVSPVDRPLITLSDRAITDYDQGAPYNTGSWAVIDGG
jgi:hypothetical protein